MTTVKDLPDYPAIQQLARALWRNGSARGAAIMVGAGFTRNVTRPGEDTRQPPLWDSLRLDLVSELYRDHPERAPVNPLRIAEEYRTTFGQAALDDFIRSRFPDKAWLPGALHIDLLDLPWADVLTTNWDTVLERAIDQVPRRVYDIVRFETDLTHAQNARIVKLHGTLGDTSPLIFAEQDYRTYPTDYPAFVNFARQVFIENELCLIGFSGDDPNFLQWSGWVRDQLKGSTRRIYLVGYLNLAPATRRYFEAHNIAPVDFAPILKEIPEKERHAEAARLFFEALRSAEPRPGHEWALASSHDNPATRDMAASDRVRKDVGFAIEVLEDIAKILRKDRYAYPGWVVCPRPLRRQLQFMGAEQWVWRKEVLDAIPPARRALILFELVWRRTVGFTPLEEPLEKAVAELLASNPKDVDSDFLGELALGLMRLARASDNEDSFKVWGEYLDARVRKGAPLHLAAQYQRCLRARDLLDHAKVVELVDGLQTDEPDWQMRRAALLAEAGQTQRAEELFRGAESEFAKRARLDRKSLWVRSRQGWAEWIVGAIDLSHAKRRENDARAHYFRKSNIDPAEEIDFIERAATHEEQRLRRDAVNVRPLFQAGHYRDGKKRARGDGILDRYEADQLIEAVGLPVRFNNVSLAGTMAISTAEASYRPTFEWYSWLLRGLHSHYDEAFEDYFGRLAIARLPQEEADRLIAACDRSVDYWLDKFESAKLPKDRSDFGTALDALRLNIMALAHLTVRMSVADAMAAYRKGIALARNAQINHHWIVEAIGKLLTYAAESIPKDQRGQLAEDAIDFPLSSEKGVQNNFLWPKVATTLWGSVPQRADNPHWHHRIALLIEAARSSSAREEAVLLLSYLAEKGALLNAERVAFGEALWSQLDSDANPLPAKSGLLESTYLHLPAPHDIDVRARVRARVMDSNVDQILTLPKPLSSGVLADKQNQLYALQNTKALGLPLSVNRALELFLQFLSWTPTPGKRNDPFSTSMIDGFNDGLRRVIGDILAYVVVPAIAREARTASRGQALIEFIGLNQIWRALPALPYFVASDNALYSDAVTAIRRAIWGGDHQQVGSAAVAVGTWARLADEGNFGRNIPIPLKEGLLAAVEARPEHGLGTLLQVAKQLAELGFFGEDDRLRLVGALESLLIDLRYDGISDHSMRAVSVSLERAQSIELARVLQRWLPDSDVLRRWVEEGRNDPLPEVRFAATGQSED